MKDSGFDLLGLSNVPEVLSQISAGSTGDVHSLLIFIMAGGAFPFVIIVNDYLSVKAANVTVVALGIELRILYIFVYEADDILKCLKVMAHIGDLNVRDSSA